MIYYDFFKNSSKINIKEKEENHLRKPVKEMVCPLLRVREVQTDGFGVSGGNADSIVP